MKNIKHSKYRNTGLLFELLTRQMTQDVLNGTGKESPTLPIIREFFGKNTEVKKELDLYRVLSEKKVTDPVLAHKLIDATQQARKALNETRLNRQKYNIIKRIKADYLLEAFFDFRITNYKELASIYTLFEYNASDNPPKYIGAERVIKEHLSKKGKTAVAPLPTEMKVLKEETKDTQDLTYFIAVDKFNSKYESFNKHQKALLHEVIYNQQNTTLLREFVLDSVVKLRGRLKKLITKVDNESATKIKLQEMVNVLSNYHKVRKFSDNHIMALLQFYDLEDELRKLG